MKIRRARRLVPLALLAFAPAQTAEPVVVLAAGDIAYCTRTGDESTAALIDANPDATVLALGDLGFYEDGSARSSLPTATARAGKALKARTRPVPGNHEYHQAGAAPYFAYFGTAAGESGNGYYTYTLGTWHVVALNSEISMSVSSPQVWLGSASTSPRTRPPARWPTGIGRAGRAATTAVRPAERARALYDAGADVLTLAWSDA